MRPQQKVDAMRALWPNCLETRTAGGEVGQRRGRGKERTNPAQGCVQHFCDCIDLGRVLAPVNLAAVVKEGTIVRR